jgi:hypothetical protein
MEGDAVECGPAMRAAIVELAKELGLRQDNQDPASYHPNIRFRHGFVFATSGEIRNPHTPEAFIAKMRVEASKPRPIIIDGRTLEFLPGGAVKVGCQTIDTTTLDLILERSKARR